MPRLNALEAGIAARKGGWPEVLIPWAIATSFGESGWNTDAIGDGAKFGDPEHDYFGMMQISDIHKDKWPNVFPPSDKWKDPVVNFSMAWFIYGPQGSNQGKTAFSGRPEKSDEAKKVAGQAVLAAKQVLSMGITPSPQFGGIEVDGSQQTETIVGGKIPDIASNIWQSALSGAGPYLWIGGGAILVLVGGLLLAKSELLGGVGKVLAA